MIKMLEKLVVKYHDQDRIFLSWDAASWHSSKELMPSTPSAVTPQRLGLEWSSLHCQAVRSS